MPERMFLFNFFAVARASALEDQVVAEKVMATTSNATAVPSYRETVDFALDFLVYVQFFVIVACIAAGVLSQWRRPPQIMFRAMGF